jgi:hypothetical protein
MLHSRIQVISCSRRRIIAPVSPKKGATFVENPPPPSVRVDIEGVFKEVIAIVHSPGFGQI